MENFWVFECIQIVFVYCFTFFLGLLVTNYNIKVNYTRKIFSLSLLFLTMFLVNVFPFESSPYTTAINGIILVLCFISMVKPIRNRFSFLTTTFSAVNRPEDEPYTLLWLPTELIIMSSILFIMQAYLSNYEQSVLFYIIILISGIGDGLAEPIGISFGKHKYKVKSLVLGREYVRSVEGSLCVFVTGTVVVIYFQDYMTPDQFVWALFIIPITMTLTEAFSPHTWDGPFLYLMGSVATIIILEASPNSVYMIQRY
ncbi:MAG: hypothetical protein V3U87_15605 [Methylococcaceae bacterium]